MSTKKWRSSLLLSNSLIECHTTSPSMELIFVLLLYIAFRTLSGPVFTILPNWHLGRYFGCQRTANGIESIYAREGCRDTHNDTIMLNHYYCKSHEEFKKKNSRNIAWANKESSWDDRCARPWNNNGVTDTTIQQYVSSDTRVF